MTSMASFEPKEFMDRQSNMYLPEDPSRPMSRSLLLPDFQSVPFPRDGNSGEATPRFPPAVFSAARNEYSRPSRVASWHSSKSASISVASRSPTRKHKSITRIMSILEGYPFQHEISSTEGIGSRSESPNWSSTDHDYYARSIPVSVPTGD
ncbi:hypothetical protein CPB84DRAFT_1761381 [Gymnopilus junonius]|uniref:Uncharacterized protein n=1 Tax=Gymnopilus junonius TaxID=109634 RepID=A0A9P5TUV1_GYMJU|nr:hypothetical protein CPB84DRAFT_1761381 [Gymnopilus junonius]